MQHKSISIFFPALNEQDNIVACISSAKKFLDKRFADYEIIVVANGSTDDTDKIVKELAKKDKRIKLVNDKKRGYGVALRSGFAHCTKELVFYTDSDNQFDINEMDKLLPMLKKYDIVNGYRIKRRDPWMRIFIANVYNLIVRVLFQVDVKDIDSAFKLYKKEIFNNMHLKSVTGLIDAEVFIKAKKKGFTIGQVGVNHYPRLHGNTVYEVGNRNKVFAVVRPKVVLDILKEIKTLWSDLR